MIDAAAASLLSDGELQEAYVTRVRLCLDAQERHVHSITPLVIDVAGDDSEDDAIQLAVRDRSYLTHVNVLIFERRVIEEEFDRRVAAAAEVARSARRAGYVAARKRGRPDESECGVPGCYLSNDKHEAPSWTTANTLWVMCESHPDKNFQWMNVKCLGMGLEAYQRATAADAAGYRCPECRARNRR